MTYQALARKYRPQSFRDIIGQEAVVRTLQNAIEQNRIHHAYLFSGVRGVGKTTSARIFAKALNCSKGPAKEPCNECTICREITEGIDLDVREIDAATYTGVDNVRELRDVSQFQPARDRYRIFIIDEAHMLSGASWNALLKIIEEPPEHVVFMFATTEIQKVPQTILSRVQKFMLRKISLEELIGRLDQIAKKEGIKADRDALEIVARRGEGSVRDALSILDQVIAFSGREITSVDVAAILGLADTTFFARLMRLIGEGDHAGILAALEEASSTGRDFKLLYRDLLNFVRNLLLVAGGASQSVEDPAALRSLTETFSYSELLRIANLLIRDDETVNNVEHQRLAVEIALLKAATFPRLKSVEEAIAGGGSSKPAMEPRLQPGKAPAKAAPSDDAQPLFERLQKARPLLAGYLAGAKTMRKEGNRVIWTFDDEHLAQPLIDAKPSLEQIAAEVYGGPTSSHIETVNAPAAAKADKQQSPLREDPVVKAFAKHLGGEIDSRKR